MSESSLLASAFEQALSLALGQSGAASLEMWNTVALSLKVAACSSLLSCCIGLPFGTWLATHRFVGRSVLVALLNAMLGLPAVIVGLIAYLLLSRSGPFGSWGLLFSPAAMVFAQTLLITPMVAALTRAPIETAWLQYRELFHSIGLSGLKRIQTLLWDCRYSLSTVVLTALGRALSEVGAVMTVGGNIAGFTRVMTTSIALETSKGDLALALALGIVLMALVLTLMALAQWLSHRSEAQAGQLTFGR